MFDVDNPEKVFVRRSEATPQGLAVMVLDREVVAIFRISDEMPDVDFDEIFLNPVDYNNFRAYKERHRG